MSDKDKKVKIKIEGDGIFFEEEISKTKVPQIISICISPQQNQKNNSYEEPELVLKKQSKESVVEYVQRHNANSNPEKILAFAGFTKNIQEKEVFFKNEVKSLFRDAREILPANFTRDFNLVISNGWIHGDSETKDAYYITQTGSKALDSGFSEVMHSKKTSGRKK